MTTATAPTNGHAPAPYATARAVLTRNAASAWQRWHEAKDDSARRILVHFCKLSPAETAALSRLEENLDALTEEDKQHPDGDAYPADLIEKVAAGIELPEGHEDRLTRIWTATFHVGQDAFAQGLEHWKYRHGRLTPPRSLRDRFLEAIQTRGLTPLDPTNADTLRDLAAELDSTPATLSAYWRNARERTRAHTGEETAARTRPPGDPPCPETAAPTPAGYPPEVGRAPHNAPSARGPAGYPRSAWVCAVAARPDAPPPPAPTPAAAAPRTASPAPKAKTNPADHPATTALLWDLIEAGLAQVQPESLRQPLRALAAARLGPPAGGPP